MIKQLTIVKRAASEQEWKQLSSLLESLGFALGSGWAEGQSHGSAFNAPLATLEIYAGPEIPYPEIMVEVSDLSAVREQINRSGIGELSAIRRTTWNSDLFTFTAGALTIGFWQFENARKLPFQTIEGELNVNGARFGIVCSRFNGFITERLLQSATDALRRSGTRDEDITIVRVPGAFEVPIGARKLAGTGNVDAVICLGLLMRGETSNYEHISDEVARGIGQSAQDTGVPHSYGVLTCDTLEQAIDRAGLKAGNKGFEAAIAAVEMVALSRKLEKKAQAK
jgi:6,7-dimethyl-8-ribityllumazine synthase